MHEINELNRLDRLDLNLFRVFDTVYRERNLTHAAEILSLSQSAVSHAVGRLRVSLGDPLFVREGQGVVPTPLADRLWPDVKEALALFRQAVLRNQSFEPARDISHITLAMNDKLEPSILPVITQALHAKIPNLELSSIRLDRENLRADLVAGRIDFAIDVAQPTSPDICHVSLLKDEFAVVSRQPRELDAGAYLAARHITVSSRRSGKSVEDIALSRLGIERQVVVRCQYYEAACRLVAQSDLLLTMPLHQAMTMNTALGNVILPLPLSLPGIELHLYWHQQRQADPANQWLRGELMGLFDQKEEKKVDEIAGSSEV
ncbi:LysR family transcriptional regulator [Aquirhabdus parva]|uniref:LysR family transcriptional regulator n=1 Tax=Aquirhabdus parva TaxID=2283318 RepID=A0A345P7M3_9GAMM|nr:LysR family transcriptional regulator [Aquirhabdus parva]AXI03282.1 LysR family transcriptional regulator [Aquirhabdus parva]